MPDNRLDTIRKKRVHFDIFIICLFNVASLKIVSLPERYANSQIITIIMNSIRSLVMLLNYKKCALN